MNAKNLPLKFGLFVLLPALLCLWFLFLGKGLSYGIDISGGTVLEFRIRPSEGGAPEQGNLSQQAIGVLKNRIDPDGLRNLEWTPIGENRFEVRMPAASEASRQAKKEYLDALDKLESTNLQRSEIQRLLDAPAERREQVIEAIALDDTAMAARLRELSEADLAVEAARSAIERTLAAQAELPPTGADQRRKQLAEQLQAARDALVEAEAAFEQMRGEVYATNVSRSMIETVMRNYLSPREKAMIATEDEVERRLATFRTGVQQLREMFADPQADPNAGNPRLAQLDRVIEEYRDWANVRQHLEDPQDLIRLIQKAGVLEFRIAPVVQKTRDNDIILPNDDIRRLRRRLQIEGPESQAFTDYAWFPLKDPTEFENFILTDYAGRTYVLLANTPNLTMLQDQGDWRLANAFPDRDRTNRPAVGFAFDEAGAQRFGQLTSDNVGRPMAILLDDEVYSAPTIQTVIDKRGVITGRFTAQEVMSLVGTLQAGRLHGRIDPNPVSVRTFAPVIGEANKQRGFSAAYIGLAAVVVFILVYYLVAGAVADVALVLNILLVLGAMSMFDARLTLPGIAGIILTIGIAVDANVLIFERLREEQGKNQTVRMALKNAYERAFSAIIDANATTLITCLILAWIGTEEVRGFAITLGFGVLFSLFTALIVTRWIFQVLLDLRILKKPLPMLKLIGTPSVNWFGKRYVFWAVSGVMVVLGVASLAWQGGDILGIEFSSGSKATITFRQGATIDVARYDANGPATVAAAGGELPGKNVVTEALTEVADGPEFKKFRDTLTVTAVIDQNAVEAFLDQYDGDADGAVTQAEYVAAGGQAAYFQKLSGGGDRLDAQALAAALPSRSYEISTTAQKVERDGAELNPLAVTIDRAFGDLGLLDRRRPLDYELVAGQAVPELGITVAADGNTAVTEEMLAGNQTAYQADLQDFLGGVVYVVQDVQPAQTVQRIRDRINDMRAQPDFAAGQIRDVRVVELGQGEQGQYRSFAIFVSPGDDAVGPASPPHIWSRFTDAAHTWAVQSPLKREDSLLLKSFDPAIAGQAVARAVIAVLLSCLAIIAYLWLRFGSARWGLAAIVCLLHDVLIVVGLVAISGWLSEWALGRVLGIESFKIDLTMIAALLTVIGYSVNDTIVIFDRIRENRGRLMTVRPEVINASINQTLSRTLLTSGTTFLVVIIMYVAGGPGIHAFSFALLAGVIFGTYSSIAVASPLLMGVKEAIVAKAVAPEGA